MLMSGQRRSTRPAAKAATSAIADDAGNPPVSAATLIGTPHQRGDAAAPKAPSYAAAASSPPPSRGEGKAPIVPGAAPVGAAVGGVGPASVDDRLSRIDAALLVLLGEREKRRKAPRASAADMRSAVESLPQPSRIAAGTAVPSLSSYASPPQLNGSASAPPGGAAPPDLHDDLRHSFAPSAASVSSDDDNDPGSGSDEGTLPKRPNSMGDAHALHGATVVRSLRGPNMLAQTRASHHNFAAWHRAYAWKQSSIGKQASTLCRALDALVDERGLAAAHAMSFEILACRLSALQAVDTGKWTFEQAAYLEVPDAGESLVSLPHQQEALRLLALHNKAKPPGAAAKPSAGGGGGGKRQGGRGSRGRGARGGAGDKNAKGGGGASTGEGAPAAKS